MGCCRWWQNQSIFVNHTSDSGFSTLWISFSVPELFSKVCLYLSGYHLWIQKCILRFCGMFITWGQSRIKSRRDCQELYSLPLCLLLSIILFADQNFLDDFLDLVRLVLFQRLCQQHISLKSKIETVLWEMSSFFVRSLCVELLFYSETLSDFFQN